MAFLRGNFREVIGLWGDGGEGGHYQQQQHETREEMATAILSVVAAAVPRICAAVAFGVPYGTLHFFIFSVFFWHIRTKSFVSHPGFILVLR